MAYGARLRKRRVQGVTTRRALVSFQSIRIQEIREANAFGEVIGVRLKRLAIPSGLGGCRHCPGTGRYRRRFLLKFDLQGFRRSDVRLRFGGSP